ncbi:MAG: Zn-ribbon domain-containing OB-fold protein [Dehalococcoidia bacterium]
MAEKPYPMPDDVSRPYWEAANEGRLAIQRCAACARWVHTPEAVCPGCGSSALAFQDVSGKGRVYSFTVVRDNVTKGFEDQVPYVVGLIELAEQPRLIVVTNVVGCDPERVRVGMPVEVTFEPITAAQQIPQFRPARSLP